METSTYNGFYPGGNPLAEIALIPQGYTAAPTNAPTFVSEDALMFARPELRLTDPAAGLRLLRDNAACGISAAGGPTPALSKGATQSPPWCLLRTH